MDLTSNDAIDAYGVRADELARTLGATVSPGDPDRAVIDAWAATVPGRILDVGAGTGRWSGHLAGLGYTVEGLEPVERFVDLARRAHPAVDFRLGSINDLVGSQERWAGILAWYSLIHMGPGELPKALAILRAVLEDRGSILMSFFSGPRLEASHHPATIAYRWPMVEMDRVLDDAGFETTRRHENLHSPHANLTARVRPDRHGWS